MGSRSGRCISCLQKMTVESSRIVLATINARYYHSAFGLRCLLANMDELQAESGILEFEGRVEVSEAADAILERSPGIIGLGIYIWNAVKMAELIRRLREADPNIIIVAGGPEVSYSPEPHPVAGLADYTICGEADLAFAKLCRELLAGTAPTNKIIKPAPPDLNSINPPYRHYSEEDIAHRIIYVEASRGCPFRCEYCISALDNEVRHFPVDAWFAEMRKLLDRGARKFNFVDRTFNIQPSFYLPILDFFRKNYCEGLELHLELAPMLFPDVLKESLKRFPPGTLRLEVGVQTLNEEVNSRIARRQNAAKTLEVLNFIVNETSAHLHIDLIAGLPGESLESIASSFDRLVSTGADELQFGILKRLPGAPIGRHDREWGMRYEADPPYAIQENRLIDKSTIQRLKRFARYWEIVVNRDRFPRVTQRYIRGASSPFSEFMRLSDWLYVEFERTNRIDLDDLARALFNYLIQERNAAPDETAKLICADYCAGGARRVPPFFAKYSCNITVPAAVRKKQKGGKRANEFVNREPRTFEPHYRGCTIEKNRS